MLRASFARVWTGLVGLALLLSACANIEDSMQDVIRTRVLSGTMHETPDGYTSIRDNGVHELSDGRVLLLDYIDASLFVIDFSDGTRRSASRAGRGPGEFEGPRALLPYRNDSVLLVDFARFNSLIAFDPSGRATNVLRTGHEEIDERFYTYHTAADTVGHVYAWIALRRVTDGVASIRLDSAAIERTALSTRRRDTVAWLNREPVAPGLTTAAQAARTGAQPFRTRLAPFAVAEQYTVLPDGTVAIVSPDPYQVRFIAPDGVRTEGPVLPTTLVPVTEAAKARWRENDLRPVRVLSYRAPSPTPVVRTEQSPQGEPDEWPTHLPPFVDRGVSSAPDGTVWVQRTAPVDSASAVDVIGRDGRIQHRIALPAGTRFAAASAQFIYLVRTDADDVEYLQRWPRPT